MAEPFGDQLNPGSGKRPAPTIEGTATEVSIEPTPGETDSPGGAAEAEKSESEGLETKRGAKKPPPRTSPTELKGFVTHLAAGLLGGLIGVVALALFWNKLPVRTAAAPDLTQINSRLSKLESAPAPEGDSAALGALDSRIKTLEERKVETPPDLGDLPSRVARLEESMNALAETAKEGGSVPDAAALDAKIGDLEQRLQAKIDSALAAQQSDTTTDVKDLQKEVEALKAKLGALAEAHLAGDTSDLAPQLTTLDQRIAKLETALPELSTAIGRSAASAKSGAAAIAFANLRNAVAAGHPYAAELAALRSLIPDPGDLGALPGHAETGIPTVADLSAGLTKLAEASAAAPAAPAGTSILDSMMASAKSAISIRRIGADVAGDEPSAVLARAEAALQQGDLASAIKEIETLPAPAHDAFAGWLDDARARASANDSLSKLESTVLASLGGSSGPEAKP
ncbi:MAG TPA: mitofilin family membrane protein [Methyloceanibacter sp.]|nr:mitofilin family membrane protein [Methyloceanibacter sp.]